MLDVELLNFKFLWDYYQTWSILLWTYKGGKLVVVVGRDEISGQSRTLAD
jgi:hypothetical protein